MILILGLGKKITTQLGGKKGLRRERENLSGEEKEEGRCAGGGKAGRREKGTLKRWFCQGNKLS